MKKSYSILKATFIFLFLSVIQLSCDVPPALEEISKKDSSKHDEIQVLTTYIENFLTCGSKVSFKDGYFRFQGDIGISYQDAKDRYDAFKNNASGRTSQTKYQYLVFDNYIRGINVYVAPNIPNTVRQATIDAINDYNSITGTKLRFYLTNYQSAANITVNAITGPDSGWGTFPSISGQPGANIYINGGTSCAKCQTANRRKQIVAHELGHAVGLCHTTNTTEQNCAQIAGTPLLDENSLMNGTTPGTPIGVIMDRNPIFTQSDLDAIRTLYPNDMNPIPRAGIVYRNRVSDAPDPNGGDYSYAQMYITLTDVNGNPTTGSGEVKYIESTDPLFNSYSIYTVYFDNLATEVYIGERTINDMACSSPTTCQGVNYYRKVIENNYASYRPRATFYP